MTIGSLQTLDLAAVEVVSTGAIAVDAFVIIGDRVGLALSAAAASGVTIPVALIARVTKLAAKTSGEAWTFGDRLYFDESTLKFTKTKKRVSAGIAASAQASASTVGDVLLGVSNGSSELIDLLLVGTDTLTNVLAETAFAKSITVKANTLNPGDMLRIAFQGIVTAQNAAETHRAKLHLGTVSLGATTLLDTTAIDPGTNDLFGGEIELTLRTIGASGTAYGRIREAAYMGASGTAATKPGALASFSIDTTVDQILTVGMIHSLGGGNTDRLDAFYAQKIR